MRYLRRTMRTKTASARRRARRGKMNARTADWPDRLFETLKRGGVRQVRRASWAIEALEGGRKLRKHFFAGAHLPLSTAHVHHHARRMGGVQSLAGAHGIDNRSGAQVARGEVLPRPSP